MSQPDIQWILDNLVSYPRARHAILLSGDGLSIGASAGVTRDLADQVAAIATGMQSLSHIGAPFVHDEPTAWQQTMVSYGDGHMFVLAAGDGSFLAVSATHDVDVEGLSYHMTKAIDSLRSALAVAPRSDAAGQG
ncbi:roadblock/LC7 domain-containing protein [Streptomyces sp. NPDC055897]